MFIMLENLVSRRHFLNYFVSFFTAFQCHDLVLSTIVVCHIAENLVTSLNKDKSAGPHLEQRMLLQDYNAAYNSSLVAEGDLFFEEGEAIQVSHRPA